MADVDPLKVVRNPETLAAWRGYRREMWAAGQPWLAIAWVAAPTAIGLSLYGMYRLGSSSLGLAPAVGLLVSGLSFAIAHYRMWRFRRARPFELP